MALSVAFPPMSAMHTDPIMNSYSEPGGPFARLSCGFEPMSLSCIKTEPVCEEDVLQEASIFQSSPCSFYTPLTPPSFRNIKHGQSDLYSDCSEQHDINSWVYKHPENWEAKEVLDWVFSLTECNNFDGAVFRGEAYNTLTGKQMCCMDVKDFLALDQNYGASVHEIFNWLLEDANFKKPLPPECIQTEKVRGSSMPHLDFVDFADDLMQHTSSQPPTPSPPADSRLSVYVDSNGNEMKVSLHGLGLYDIDVSTLTSKHTFGHIDDSDYHSGSEKSMERRRHSVSSDVFEPFFSDDEEGTSLVLSDLGRKTHTPCSTSSDSGCEGEDRRHHGTRRRQPSSSKGNHLWEFIRDLLKDPVFNPALVKWEDKEQGVFKFVQSEAVAQLWGRKKNNPQMTYEKLSRAMRFCRSAGYFDSVPKTGRFPKKLCFKFGQKAHGWED